MSTTMRNVMIFPCLILATAHCDPQDDDTALDGSAVPSLVDEIADIPLDLDAEQGADPAAVCDECPAVDPLPELAEAEKSQMGVIGEATQPDDDPLDDSIDELTDDLEPAAVPEYEFSWSQGQSAVPMGSSSDRVCFLTRVTGKFEGSGERVHAYVTNGTWYLGGNSYQSGVGASARCLPVTGTSGYTGEVTWNQGDYPKSLGSSADRACFLTRMQGKFMGSGERIHVYGSEGTWYVGGNSYQSGVSASARCIKNVTYSTERVWTQGNLATLMGGTTVQACFLNKVTGKFRGSGEYVRTYKSGDSWYLSGQSFQSGVGARGRCVYK